MRAVLVIAAVALLYAAGPAEAVPKRAGAPKAVCVAKGALAHAARAGRPIAARRGAVRRAASRRASRRAAARRRARCAAARIGEAKAGRPGVPSTFALPVPFATAPVAAAPGVPAPGGAPATPGEPGPGLPPVYSNPSAVQVRAYEFRFQLSKSSVSAGDVSVEFNLSAAEDPHDLWLVREDGTGQAHSFGETTAGTVTRTTFPLTAGRWTLFCSLTGHQAAGMRSTLTVG
jgi:plastocyanin